MASAACSQTVGTSARSAAVKFSSTNAAGILAPRRSADPDPHPLKVLGAQRGCHRAQPVVTALTTADLQPDLTEVDVEIVVDDQDVGGRHRIELGQRAHLAAGLVHVAAWLGQHDRTSAQPAGDDLRAGTLVHLEL